MSSNISKCCTRDANQTTVFSVNDGDFGEAILFRSDHREFAQTILFRLDHLDLRQIGLFQPDDRDLRRQYFLLQLHSRILLAQKPSDFAGANARGLGRGVRVAVWKNGVGVCRVQFVSR